MDDRLSVIVAIYNVDKYLKECLESIIHQSYENLEVILIDDGSTDSSGLICDEYQKKDKRIIVKHKTNGGLVNARKDGLKISSCNWVTFVDGDDWLEKDYYRNMMNCLLKNKVDILASGYTDVYVDRKIEFENVIKSGIYEKDKIYKEIIPYLIIDIRDNMERNMLYSPGMISSVVNKIFRRDLVNKVLPFIDSNISLGEDLVCTVLCVEKADVIEIKNDIYGYNYRRNEASMTHMIDNNISQKLYELYRYFDMNNTIKSIKQQLELHAVNQLILGIRKGFGRKFQGTISERYVYIDNLCENMYIKKALKNCIENNFWNLNFSNGMKNILKQVYKKQYTSAYINYNLMRLKAKLCKVE